MDNVWTGGEQCVHCREVVHSFRMSTIRGSTVQSSLIKHPFSLPSPNRRSQYHRDPSSGSEIQKLSVI